jgi:hypothetical protein
MRPNQSAVAGISLLWKSKRVRSRGEARRNIHAAWETVSALLAFAERGVAAQAD